MSENCNNRKVNFKSSSIQFVPHTDSDDIMRIKPKSAYENMWIFLNFNHGKPPTYYGQLLWPSSGRCFYEGYTQRQPNPHTNIKYCIKFGIRDSQYMLKYIKYR